MSVDLKAAASASIAAMRHHDVMEIIVNELIEEVERLRADTTADAVESNWLTAALLKDRTRRAIRERFRAGELAAHIALDYSVPLAFVEFLGADQRFEDQAAIELVRSEILPNLKPHQKGQ